MEIQIRAKGLPGAAGIRQLAACKIREAVNGFSEVVDTVNVLLTDTNGPDRGGIDKLCRAVIRLHDGSLFVIEELGKAVASVIERIAERMNKYLAEQIRRQSTCPQLAPPA